MKRNKKLRIGLADDHALFRQALKVLILSKLDCEIVFDVSDGAEVIQMIEKEVIPDIILMDLNLGKIQTKETVEWFAAHSQNIKIIIISMCSDEDVITSMILSGARAYLHKSSSADILMECIEAVWQNDWYLSETMTVRLLKDLQKKNRFIQTDMPRINETEKRILCYLCQEYTHTEIAKKMFLSARTIDDYSNKLAKKLNVRSKAGLIVYAVKNNLDMYVVENR